MSLQLEWESGSEKDTYVTLFAEVIIPLPVPKLYTYRIPNEWNDLVFVGSRVIIQFGAKKIYTAIVSSIKDTPPEKISSEIVVGCVGFRTPYISKAISLFSLDV